jgi:hypothetical protein
MQTLQFLFFVLISVMSAYFFSSKFQSIGRVQHIIFALIVYILTQGAVVQILSILYFLNVYSVFIFNLLIFIFLIFFNLKFFKNRSLSFNAPYVITNLWANFQSKPFHFRFLTFIWLLTIFLLAILTPLGFPSADAYHWEMQKYWLQNSSILNSGIINDYKIINFSFLHEILILPFFLFNISLNYSTLLPILFFILYPFLMADIANKLSFPRYYGFISGVIISSFTVVIKSIFKGANDFSAPFWVFVSIYLLIYCREKSPRVLTYLAFSILSFCVALGFKNTTVFLIPLYILLVFVIFLRYDLLKADSLKVLIYSFIIGLLFSGTIWVYLSNYFIYDDLRGFATFVLPSESMSWISIKTRIVRGLLYLFSDFDYTPFFLEQHILNFHRFILKLFGVHNSLLEEGGYFKFYENLIPTRSAFGIVCSLFFLPTLFFYFYSILNNKLNKNQTFWLAIFCFSSLVSFLMIHTFLNWQPRGLFRLNIHFAILFGPLLIPFISYQSIRSVLIYLTIPHFLFVSAYLLLLVLPFDLFPSSSLWSWIQSHREIKPAQVTVKNFDRNIITKKLLPNLPCDAIDLTFKSLPEGYKGVAFAGYDLEPVLCIFKHDLLVNVFPMIDHRETNHYGSCPTFNIHPEANYIFVNSNMNQCLLLSKRKVHPVLEATFDDKVFTLYRIDRATVTQD